MRATRLPEHDPEKWKPKRSCSIQETTRFSREWRDEQDDPAGDGEQDRLRPPVFPGDAVQGRPFLRRGDLSFQYGLALRLRRRGPVRGRRHRRVLLADA